MAATADEVRKIADDIAVAIRARGQFLADEARSQNLGPGADFIVRCFGQAADVATIRGIQMQLAALRQTDKATDHG